MLNLRSEKVGKEGRQGLGEELAEPIARCPSPLPFSCILYILYLVILAKTIRPLPAVKTDEDGNVHDAFVDPELRYRMRYVDLVVNDHVKETFIARSKIIKLSVTILIHRVG